MEDMEFFDQETALPFGDEFMLTLSPLGDELSTEQYGSQEQADERVSSPSLYSNFTSFPQKNGTLSDDFSKDTLTAQIVGLINQPFVTVSIEDAPQKGLVTQNIELSVSPPTEGCPPLESPVSLTTLSSPIDPTGSDLLELVSSFPQQDDLDPGQLVDPNMLFDFGQIPTLVAQNATAEQPCDAIESSLDILPALLDSFQPDDVDNIGQDELDSILASYPSSPTESMEPCVQAEREVGDGSRPALEGFLNAQEVDAPLEPAPRKAKSMRVARSTRCRRPKPYDDFVLEEEREARPIGRPSDPTLLLPDRKLRKKDQNRDAALRYRQKKKKEMDSVYEEAQHLEESNRHLKDKVEELTHDIDLLKNILREKYLKEGKQLPTVLKSK